MIVKYKSAPMSIFMVKKLTPPPERYDLNLLGNPVSEKLVNLYPKISIFYTQHERDDNQQPTPQKKASY